MKKRFDWCDLFLVTFAGLLIGVIGTSIHLNQTIKEEPKEVCKVTKCYKNYCVGNNIKIDSGLYKGNVGKITNIEEGIFIYFVYVKFCNEETEVYFIDKLS